jgi:cellobiose-specific phosphotransferase system component IIB
MDMKKLILFCALIFSTAFVACRPSETATSEETTDSVMVDTVSSDTVTEVVTDTICLD